MPDFSAGGETRFCGPTCQSPYPVTLGRMMGGSYMHHRHEGLRPSGRCNRPLWGGDGRPNGLAAIIGGEEVPMCALCWHNWCATQGAYRLLGLNAAAAYVDVKAAATLEALFIESRTDPRKVAAVPASFLEAMWGDDGIPDASALDGIPDDPDEPGTIEWR